ncbi:MAG: hypothetical protein IT431_13475 [Phycisphaerales bacterium]|nr:hypothetical protein [Phycisphaerales bacterium]
MRQTTRTVSLLAAAAPIAAAPNAVAQDGDALANFSFSLHSQGSYTASSDIDGGGEVAVGRVGPTLGVRYSPDDSASLDLSFGAEFSFYDFDNATGIVAGGDPAGDFAEYSIGAMYTARATDDWSWFVGARASWAGEESENLGDGFTAGGTAGATYRVNDSLRLGLGIAARSRIEDDAVVFPLPVIDWRISDQWSLATAESGLRLTYAPFDEWSFFAAGGWDSHEYRLLSDGPIPDGVMRDDHIPVVAGVNWHPGGHFELEATVGMSAWNQYEFLDSTGAEITDTDADAALMGGLSARIRF